MILTRSIDRCCSPHHFRYPTRFTQPSIPRPFTYLHTQIQRTIITNLKKRRIQWTPIYIKKYIKAKEEEFFWKLKYFTMPKHNLPKNNPLQETNQNPSRYYCNSIITYLKFQHKPKYIIFPKSSYKNTRPIRGQNPLSYLYSRMNLSNTISFLPCKLHKVKNCFTCFNSFLMLKFTQDSISLCTLGLKLLHIILQIKSFTSSSSSSSSKVRTHPNFLIIFLF
jgi:hypothetical protein